MISYLCIVIPVILAQQPLLLYNGASPATANCAAKTTACDCHYAACSLSGDCACGWDDVSLTCKRGVTTKCVSCPAMHHCSVAVPLQIGPNGFPVPGQLSVWGSVPYPDQSGGSAPQNSGSSRMPPPPVQVPLMPPSAQVSAQPQSQPVAQVSAQPVVGQSPAQQPQPTQLYQDNAMSAGACAEKTRPCDCHYASCTPTGDCICGWDAASKRCRAGVTTECVSCPAMRHCGTSEPLEIGPNGFPVPGQLSVWGQLPYPDQSCKGKGKGKAGKGKAKSSNSTAVGNQ